MEPDTKKHPVIRVVTGSVADRRSRSVEEMGKILGDEFRKAGCEVKRHVMVKGDDTSLRQLVTGLANDNDADVLLLVGGMGFGPHEHACESLNGLFEKHIEGFGEAYRRLLRNDLGVHAMLIRATAGVYNGCLVFAVAGTPTNLRLAVELLIAPTLPQAVAMAAGRPPPPEGRVVGASVAAWRARGRMVATPDGAAWAMEAPSALESAVPVLILHGFPTCSFDFAPMLEAISRRRRVVAFDFLGYGLSDKPKDYGYSLFEQADVALRVARSFGIQRAHVFAHDMGTSVATELLARKQRGLLPIELASVVLMNGSVHIDLAHLTLGQKLLKSPLGPLFAKLNSAGTFKAQMRRIFARPPVESDLDDMWELLSRADGAARLPSLIGYTEERSRFARRWIGALERCDIPVLVAWGRCDPVAVMAIAEQLARETPGAKLEVWNDLGHYPQVEDPVRVASTVNAFWDGQSTG